MTNPLKIFNKIINLIDKVIYNIYIIKSIIFKKYKIDDIYNISCKLHSDNGGNINLNVLAKLSSIDSLATNSRVKKPGDNLTFVIISGGAFLNTNNTSSSVFKDDFKAGKELAVKLPIYTVIQNYTLHLESTSFKLNSFKIKKVT